MKTLVVEFVKELLRVALLAVVPVVGVQFQSGKLDLKVLAAVGGAAVLKALDKALHEAGKESEHEGMTKGLVRF